MNPKQKIYESTDSSNYLTKITNSIILSRNLDNIRNRKPIFMGNNYSSLRKRKNINPIDYYVNHEQLIYSKVLGEIQKKEIKPFKDESQFNIIKHCMNIRKKYHKLQDSKISQENKEHRRRIFSQKSFLNAKSLEKEYKSRLLHGRKRDQVKIISTLLLPSINNTKR